MQYLSNFNGGELSEYLDSRIDMAKYHTGCRTLENMHVLPYGGVERRVGSKFLAEAMSSNIRLIPFNFTEDDSYVIEIGINSSNEQKIRVYNGEGYTGVEVDSPYTIDELKSIKFKRIFDVMYLISPTRHPYKFQRTSIAPLSFEIEKVAFIYPPLLEENTDFNSLVACRPIPWEPLTSYSVNSQVEESGNYWICVNEHTSGATFIEGTDWVILYQDSISVNTGNTVILKASEDIFSADMEDSLFRIRHSRTETAPGDAGTLVSTNTLSEVINVSEKSWSVDIGIFTHSWWVDPTSIVLERDTGSGWTTIANWIGYLEVENYNITGVGALNERLRLRFIFGDYRSRCIYAMGAGTNRRVGDAGIVADYTSEPMDVSFNNWQVTTGDDWNGTVELQKSLDGGTTWDVELIVADTNSAKSQNFIINSPAKEGGNTLIRIKFTHGLGTFGFNMNNQSVYSEGLVSLDEYIDANTFKATVINTLGASGATKRWTEGAFSARRGFPNAVDIHEDRVIYSGTYNNPSAIWMSVLGDYENFQLGINDDESIKIIPSTAEPCQWLLSRDTIFQASRGGLNNIFSKDNRVSITPSTVKSSEVTAFGSANIQAIFSNDVSVYMERTSKKLRAIVYSDEQDSFITEDLTILSNHITGDGIVELTFQKTPDQIIWALRSDGTLAGLTYERNQDVIGWHHHNFGGDIKSIAVRPSSGEDELWIAIKRENGTFIEKTESRTFSDDLLDAWFVDSGVKKVLPDTQTATSIDVGNSPDFKIIINKVAHGLLDGDNVKMCNASVELNGVVFTVADATNDSFALKDSINVNYINYANFYGDGSGIPDSLTVYYAGDIAVRGTYTFDDAGQYINDADPLIVLKTAINQWFIEKSGIGQYGVASTAIVPPEGGWFESSGFPPEPTIGYFPDVALFGEFRGVRNVWNNLDHLEGSLVQIQGDGGYAGVATVINGEVTTDDYYNQTVIGIPYVSVLQPMFIEPLNGPVAPMGVDKVINKTVLKFYRTIGALVGTIIHKDATTAIKFDVDNFKVDIPEEDKENSEVYNTEKVIFRKTTDNLGEPITPFTGDKLVYISDSWSRLKSLYIVQNLPMPMTVLGAAIHIKTGKEA